MVHWEHLWIISHKLGVLSPPYISVNPANHYYMHDVIYEYLLPLVHLNTLINQIFALKIKVFKATHKVMALLLTGPKRVGAEDIYFALRWKVKFVENILWQQTFID